MKKSNFDQQIREDLDTFLTLKSKTSLQINDVIDIGAFVGASFLRMLYHKQKNVTDGQLNSIFGVISNHYHDLFGDQLNKSDYELLANKALDELKNTNFEQNMHDFFTKIVEESKTE